METLSPDRGDSESKKKSPRSRSPFAKLFGSRDKGQAGSPPSSPLLSPQSPGESESTPSELIREEGLLSRKHELEAGEKRAGNRSWDKLYVLLNGPTLSCYKDQKHAKTDPNNRVHHEQALDLVGSICQVAVDYTKRPFVFELKLANGSKYLFQAKDEAERELWISRINLATGQEGGAVSQAQKSLSLPARVEKEEPKKRGFFTLKKK